MSWTLRMLTLIILHELLHVLVSLGLIRTTEIVDINVWIRLAVWLMIIVMHIVKTSSNIGCTWLLDHSTTYVSASTSWPKLGNEVCLHWLSLIIFEITLFTWIQRTTSWCIFVLRIWDLITFITWCFLQTFPLLVIYLTVSISWHYRTLLTYIWMLHLIIVLRLCIANSTLRILTSVLNVRT